MKKIDFTDLILFENTDFIAINKPPGISTLEDRKVETNLLNIAKNSYPDIQVCHRIDKDTSGVLVFAKNPTGYRHLSLQFQNRQVKKIYHAVVYGKSEFRDKLIDIPLIEKNNNMVIWDVKAGKESMTFFTTLENYTFSSLIACRPISGRKHQIRVHLKYIKHPIIADQIYSGENVYLSQLKKNYKSNQRTENPLINRMALHSFSISFKTLKDHEQTIEAPYPKDFVILLKQLRKYSNI